MLVYGVEGDRSAASLVKDSKTYIEIAKFVEAYTTIIQNPNEFLAEVNEEPINPETDILSWAQLVKILTTCDLGFDPVPTEKQLVSYYAYARQIGSISKEVKQLATVSDIAEAQKHYYNFVDEETEKVTTMYNKQHEIAEHRAKEVQVIDNNLKKKRSKNVMYFFGMMVSVFCIMLGVSSAAFDLLGFGGYARYIFGGISIVVGICLFYVFDKLYISSKRDFYDYHKSTREAVSRSEKTSLDEKVLRDKLAKYEKDLKIAKFELADKEKRFDVEKNIAVLREKNKYYQLLRGQRGRDYEGFGRRRRMSLINELEQSNSESLFSIFGGDDRGKRSRKKSGGILEEISDLFRVGTGQGIDEKSRVDKVMSQLTGMTEMPNGFKNYLRSTGLKNNSIKVMREIPEKPIWGNVSRDLYSNMGVIRRSNPFNYAINIENMNRLANNSMQNQISFNKNKNKLESIYKFYPEIKNEVNKYVTNIKNIEHVENFEKRCDNIADLTQKSASLINSNDLKSSMLNEFKQQYAGNKSINSNLTATIEQQQVKQRLDEQEKIEKLQKKNIQELLGGNQIER